MIEVPHYGVHWSEDGIAFLHQGRQSTNVLGLAMKSPFQVKESKGRPCNHLLPISAPVPDPIHWNRFQGLGTDPLVQAMLPLPKEGAGCYYVDDPQDLLGLKLVLLSKLSSPITSVVKLLWMTKSSDIMAELQRTNVQPLVLIRATLKDQKVVNEIIQAAPYLPRKVIIAGDPDLVITPPAQRIKTGLFDHNDRDFAELPFEVLGMTILRRYMRREAPLGDLPPPRKK
ncbi:hypothetical protein [Cupriavidus sp. RAF12]|uniref:hypothetical protein n=1 Tax=Cupriavidus sp. RAF12 TaxID=3233050 RepID=UPI003F93763F